MKINKKYKVLLFFALMFLFTFSYNFKVSAVATLPGRICIDSPRSGQSISSQGLTVTGWALNSSGVKEVDILVDGVYVGKTTTKYSRLDVNKVFPGYLNGDNSGYSYTIGFDVLQLGNEKITVRAVGNNGTFTEQSVSVNYSGKSTITTVDTPTQNSNLNGDVVVGGWAISSSGIKAVNILVDDVKVGQAIIGQSRPDVNAVFPQYTGSAKSGFSYTIKSSSIIAGNRKITVEAVSNDGLVDRKNISVVSKNTEFKYSIDTPTGDARISKSDVQLNGWVLQNAGVKQINILINGQKIGQTTTNLSRPDVSVAFPGYKNGTVSGFTYNIDSDYLKEGNVKLTLLVTDNIGNTDVVNKVLNVKQSRISIDTPKSGTTYDKSNLTIAGWSLHNAGVKEVKVIIDNKTYNAVTGQSRLDVDRVYPGYINGDKSGFAFSIDSNLLQNGSKNIVVKSIGNDGTVIESTVPVIIGNTVVSKGEICIDAPVNSFTSNNEDISVSGWAIHSYGINKIEVLINNRIVSETTTTSSRPDVAAVFKDYSAFVNVDNSGYFLKVSKNLIPEGINNLVVRAVAYNGATISASRKITMVKPVSRLAVDRPADNSNANGQNIVVGGWALNSSGIQKVEVYLNGVLYGNATIGVSRPDVNAAYPGYPTGNNSGYQLVIPFSSLAKGANTIEVKAYGNDWGCVASTKKVYNGSSKTIVIDPGHNYGGDYGAAYTLSGIYYSETQLNMDFSVKLKAILEAKGYKVIFTREAGEKSTVSLYDSLKARVSIANNNNADLFISIHHNASTSSAAKGVDVFYSSWRPNIDTSGLVDIDDVTYDNTPSLPAKNSAVIAKKIVDAIANTGYVNRGITDSNLYVTRNTNMTSVLVELGFISNAAEAAKCANPLEQNAKAAAIANAVDAFLRIN